MVEWWNDGMMEWWNGGDLGRSPRGGTALVRVFQLSMTSHTAGWVKAARTSPLPFIMAGRRPAMHHRYGEARVFKDVTSHDPTRVALQWRALASAPIVADRHHCPEAS